MVPRGPRTLGKTMSVLPSTRLFIFPKLPAEAEPETSPIFGTRPHAKMNQMVPTGASGRKREDMPGGGYSKDQAGGWENVGLRQVFTVTTKGTA